MFATLPTYTLPMLHALWVAKLARPHLPNALRSASGEVRSLSDAEYKKLRRKLGTRSQVPGAIFHPGFAGFAPSTWETVVQAPQSAHATGVAARRTVKLWLEARNGGNASLLYVHYPRRCEVNWKTGRKAAMQMYSAHNQTREDDLMAGGMVGAGVHINRLGGALTVYASVAAKATVDTACGIVTSLFRRLFTDPDVKFNQLPTLNTNKPPTWAVSLNLGALCVDWVPGPMT